MTFEKESYFIVSESGKSSIDYNKLAEYVVSEFHLKGTNGSCFLYEPDEGIWKPLNSISLDRFAKQKLEKLLEIEHIRKSMISEFVSFLIMYAESDDLESALLLDKQDPELYLDDGIYSISKNEFRLYSPRDFVFAKLPYKYRDLQKSTPIKREKFLNEILDGKGDKDDIVKFLQEYIGLALIPSTKFEKAFLTFGMGGNGKGVILNTIKELLGENLAISIGMHELNREQNRFLLFGKTALIDADMAHGVQLDSALIKKLVSGETITAKKIYAQPITFKPGLKLFLATNSLPYIKNHDSSIQRRFLFLHLENCFKNKPNPNLKEELKQELPIIFSWAVKGLKRLLNRGYFEVPKSLTNTVEDFLNENDSVQQFLDSGDIKVAPNLFIPYSRLMEMYQQFCRKAGMKPVKQSNLVKRLVQKGFKKDRITAARGIRGLGGEYGSEDEAA